MSQCDNSLSDVLFRVFPEVLANFASLAAESFDVSHWQATTNPHFTASIKFSGETSGEVTLAVPSTLATVIAGSILGMAPETVEDELAVDAVGEILNIACGAFLGSLAWKDSYRLGTPSRSAYVIDQLPATAHVRCFEVDGERALLLLELAS